MATNRMLNHMKLKTCSKHIAKKYCETYSNLELGSNIKKHLKLFYENIPDEVEALDDHCLYCVLQDSSGLVVISSANDIEFDSSKDLEE